MKRLLSIAMTFSIVITSLLSSVNISYADNNSQSNLPLTAKYAYLLDYETGKVIYEKNSSEKLYPASTTKIWTAFMVLKHEKDLNKVVKIENLQPVEGSSMYLKNGESFTVRELLNSLLVHSSNDVSVVLANLISGSIEEFTKLMNKEAKLIGATNTNFNNPHGLQDPNHFTTAHDIALMSRAAMSNETFREMVKTKSIKFNSNEINPIERHFVNTNKFLTSNETMTYKGQKIPIKYDIVDGVKTGFTNEAGKCLVTSAEKNNMRLISAVFFSTGDLMYVDSRTLLDHGFDNFSSRTIVNKSDKVSKEKVSFTKQKELIYEPKSSYKLVLPNGTNISDYTTKTELDPIDLPIQKGDKVGSLKIYNKDKLEDTIDLVATNNLNSIFSFISENKIVITAVKIFLTIMIFILLAIVILIIRKFIRKSQRKTRSIYSNKNKKNNISFKKRR